MTSFEVKANLYNSLESVDQRNCGGKLRSVGGRESRFSGFEIIKLVYPCAD